MNCWWLSTAILLKVCWHTVSLLGMPTAQQQARRSSKGLDVTHKIISCSLPSLECISNSHCCSRAESMHPRYHLFEPLPSGIFTWFPHWGRIWQKIVFKSGTPYTYGVHKGQGQKLPWLWNHCHAGIDIALTLSLLVQWGRCCYRFGNSRTRHLLSLKIGWTVYSTSSKKQSPTLRTILWWSNSSLDWGIR